MLSTLLVPGSSKNTNPYLLYPHLCHLPFSRDIWDSRCRWKWKLGVENSGVSQLEYGWYIFFPCPCIPVFSPDSQARAQAESRSPYLSITSLQIKVLYSMSLYQSSSSPPLPRPCILACLALKASANPPAKLDPPDAMLLGVSRPLSLPMLTALSLGVGVGIGCFRTAALGRFAGGGGGVGLPCLVVDVPLGG